MTDSRGGSGLMNPTVATPCGDDWRISLSNWPGARGIHNTWQRRLEE
ncbi:MAG: hypothetical protein WC247_11240 [Porticoccaceae bacterium]